ncbi:protein kinase domain-containing protein [Halorussus halophilus]|uniref:protein kinase domain-containing protein n=1 Tax=Halorussus halophilus TaxID=2650975 RepID=UPI0013016B95|nr:protein kinase [Halorussus halophilus]
MDERDERASRPGEQSKRRANRREESTSDRQRADQLRERVRSEYGSDADAIATRLDSDDPEERAGAAWALAELAGEDPDRLPARSKLAALLSDDHRWVRRGASWALAALADSNPHRARMATEEVIDALSDDDPLVRENTVLTLSSVATEYPRAVEPALSRLATLVNEEEGLLRKYAAETLHRLVRELDEDGFPKTIAASPALANFLPGDATIVEFSDEETVGESSVSVRPPEFDTDSGEDTTDDARSQLGPPDYVSTPPEIDAGFRDFERLADRGSGPFTTFQKARAPDPESASGSHVVVTLRAARRDGLADEDALSRALRAWDAISDHNHVLPIVARGETPRPWVATEFVDGGTVRDRIGGLDFAQALWYAHCVTTALCHAHAQGVLHGALRPGVVGLSQSFGAWSVPKVGDWGFGVGLPNETRPPVPPAFAAPEQLAPEEFGRLDHATDVYQLGALCYALFAGRPPFVGDSKEVARRVQKRDPAPASSINSAVPEAVDGLLTRALTKEKPARFETAEDFRRELEVVVEEYATWA